MKKNLKNTILLSTMFLMFNNLSLVSQNLNPTYAITAPGSADTFKGGYTFAYATSGTPWNGSLISYGGFANQYDTQINSDYGPAGGSHISYRTKNGDAQTWNPWNELATRGVNSFIGNQSINGNLNVFETSESKPAGQKASTKSVLKLSRAGTNSYSWNEFAEFRIGHGSNTTTGSKLDLYINGIGNTTPIPDQHVMTWNYDGSVGIGTTNPDAKLAVNGTIHSKEVKVDVNGWPDYVFKKEYDLPTLQEVEKHINEKGYLENIPSEEEVLKNGINLGEMNIKLLQKIEELTLYTIEQQKNTEKLTKVIKTLTKRLEIVERK